MSELLVLHTLFDLLWEEYRLRVPHAARYQAMVEQRGGKVQNDHLAFRSFNCDTGAQPPGVEAVAQIIAPLGYRRKDRYVFADKHLTAWHWEHETSPEAPKIFTSQLEVAELPAAAAAAIEATVKGAPDLLAPQHRDALAWLAKGEACNDKEAERLAEHLAGFFVRPWHPPFRRMIIEVNRVSQYAAWTLLHGNEVNHFTACINAQNVTEWPDIAATVAALREAGVPMKSDLEGEVGSRLCQSSTEAVDEDCDVIEDDGSPGKLRWSYAYYELAQRGDVPGPDGRPTRFEAFLGGQATNLFEMTKR